MSNISYFRFKSYSYSFKDYKSSKGNYIEGTTFDEIRDLYLFDRKLKLLVFEAFENIEVAVKTQLTNAMAGMYGAHWYSEAKYFISDAERRRLARGAYSNTEILKAFDHDAFLKKIESYMKDPDELFLRSYKNNYEPIYPPSWMMVDIITFGELSILFENLQPGDEKNAIQDHFKLTKKHFISWLHCFSFIRNKCAHHAKLVYATIVIAPSLPMKKSRQFLMEADKVDNDSLYAVLCCVLYMLSICNPENTFRNDLFSLIDKYPKVDYIKLGFTPNWRQDPFWLGKPTS